MKHGEFAPEAAAAAERIKFLLMDCDGVLTDGRLYFDSTGEVMKVFNVRDGQGLVLWRAAGLMSGIISGRGAGEIIQRRAEELGVNFVAADSTNKAADFEKMISGAGVTPEETAFIGDDIGDVELMKRVGFPIAVRDAEKTVKAVAKYVTKKKGGRGAVREVVDMLLSGRVEE